MEEDLEIVGVQLKRDQEDEVLAPSHSRTDLIISWGLARVGINAVP
jgi:hypothetical protein